MALHSSRGLPNLRARLVTLSIVGFAPWGVWAQGLTLSDAVSRSVGEAPDLAAATAAVDAAKASAASAALTSPWETTFSLENFAGGGVASGLDSAEATLELGRRFESRDKREQRVRASQAAVGSADAEAATVRAERITSVFDQYVDAWAHQERARIFDEIVQVARDRVTIAQRRVESGRSSEAELASARSLAAQAELDAHLASTRRQGGLKALQLLLEPSSAHADLLTWDGSVRDLDPLLPVASADFQKAAAERKQAEAELSYATSQRSADWQLAAGVRRLEEMDTEALVFSVSRPWGTGKRAEPIIDEAAANLRRAKALEAVMTRDLGLKSEQLRAEAEARRLELATLKEAVIPQALRAKDVYRRGYALGRFSIIEIANAERDLLDARTRLIEARAALATAELGYRMLTGQWPEDNRP